MSDTEEPASLTQAQWEALERALARMAKELEEIENTEAAEGDGEGAAGAPASSTAASISHLPPPKRILPEMIIRMLLSMHDQIDYMWVFYRTKDGACVRQGTPGTMADVALMAQAANAASVVALASTP
jgi:hypothetical protein